MALVEMKDVTRAYTSGDHKLKALDGDFRVLPGHNEESTLSFEKEHNPTMRGL